MVERGDELPREWFEIPDPMATRASLHERRQPAPAGPSLTRRQVTVRRMVALPAVIGWSLAVVAAIHPRSGLGPHLMPIAAQCAIWIGLSLLGVHAAAARRRHGLGSPAWVAEILALAAPVVFVALAFVWLPAADGGGSTAVGPLRALLACFGVGLLVAVPALCLAAWALRHAFVTAPAKRGAAVGAACGLLAAAVLTLHCGSSQSGHVALAHGLPLVAATLLGVWIVGMAGRP